MPLTKGFRETIRERAQRKPRFRATIWTPPSAFAGWRRRHDPGQQPHAGVWAEWQPFGPNTYLASSLIFRRRKA